MEKLKPFIDKLKARAACQFSVMDCVSENYIAKGINQAYLDKNHNGNLVEYLNSLHKKGLQKIQLVPFRKNGSSQKTDGPAITIDFNTSGGSSTAENNVTSAPPQMQMPAGLNAAASFGLGVPDILDGYAAKRELAAKIEDFNRLLADYKEEKQKRQELRDKLEKAERKLEPSAIDKLIDGLAQNPAMIPQLIGAFKGGGGLNAPQPQEAQIVDTLEGYTDMQRALCDTIGQIPDGLCETLANIISRIAEDDKAFTKELKKLLQTPNLKKVADNG